MPHGFDHKSVKTARLSFFTCNNPNYPPPFFPQDWQKSPKSRLTNYKDLENFAVSSAGVP
jgi:hypothetical protein